MPPLSPIKRRDLIRKLRAFGFEGPYAGGKHEYLVKGTLKLFVPNPHRGEISKSLLSKILRQAGIDPDEWTQSYPPPFVPTNARLHQSALGGVLSPALLATTDLRPSRGVFLSWESSQRGIFESHRYRRGRGILGERPRSNRSKVAPDAKRASLPTAAAKSLDSRHLSP